MVRTGTVSRQRASNPQTIGKASVKLTKQSEEGPQTNKYFPLWWVVMQKKRGRAEERREEMPSSSFITSEKKKKTHIRGLWRRLEDAPASPGLVWPRCLFPVCGSLNGPNYHRYELQQGGRFCRGLQLPPGIAWEMLFSAGYVINKTAGSICWRRIDFPRDRKRRPDLRCERMFQRRGLKVASFYTHIFCISLQRRSVRQSWAGRISILI